MNKFRISRIALNYLKRTNRTKSPRFDQLFEGTEHSSLYNKFRPVAPDSLVQDIQNYYKGERIKFCIDVGCGTGLFTKLMIPHVDHILGIDVSQTQLEEARKIATSYNIQFMCGTGEKMPQEDGSVDLVTICQALHWLNVDEFYKEVYRVLKPQGVLAVIGHSFSTPAPAMGRNEELLRECLETFYDITLRPYWSTKRNLHDTKYEDLPISDALNDYIRNDSHYTEIDATLEDWVGYASTWSGFQNMRKLKGDIKAKEALTDFSNSCSEALCLQFESPKNIKLKLRTHYWLIMYRKS